jgi:hypothetical protein
VIPWQAGSYLLAEIPWQAGSYLLAKESKLAGSNLLANVTQQAGYYHRQSACYLLGELAYNTASRFRYCNALLFFPCLIE